MNLQKVINEFDRLGLTSGMKEQIMPYIQYLEEYHKPTFEHSVRVAKLGEVIANFTHIAEPKSLWLPGLVHDLGKVFIEKNLLDKKNGWNEKDFESMKHHVEYGCVLLLDSNAFSALTTFYSHYFKKENGYPSKEDFSRIFGNAFAKWSEASIVEAQYCGRLVSLADNYDAAITRTDDKFSRENKEPLSREKTKEFLLSEFSDQNYLINQLYKENIF